MVEQISLQKSKNNLATHLALAVGYSPTAEILQLIYDKREAILTIAAIHGASNIRIFGSLARHEANLDSDIDFLMNLESGRSLLNRIALIQALEDLLERKVDVASPENLHNAIREQVLKEAIPL
jgi:predicted nucleotidyltransferase